MSSGNSADHLRDQGGFISLSSLSLSACLSVFCLPLPLSLLSPFVNGTRKTRVAKAHRVSAPLEPMLVSKNGVPGKAVPPLASKVVQCSPLAIAGSFLPKRVTAFSPSINLLSACACFHVVGTPSWGECSSPKGLLTVERPRRVPGAERQGRHGEKLHREGATTRLVG